MKRHSISFDTFGFGPNFAATGFLPLDCVSCVSKLLIPLCFRITCTLGQNLYVTPPTDTYLSVRPGDKGLPGLSQCVS